MKVANIIRRFVFEEWGGTESAVWNLTKKFAKQNVSAEILATKALCDCQFERKDDVDISRFDYFYPHLFLDSKRKLSLDKKGGNPFSLGLYKHLCKGCFDVVHSHNLGRIAKTALVASRKIGAPCVLSFHGGYLDVPKSETDLMLSPLKNRIGYGKIIEKFYGMPRDVVADCDGIICVGKNEFEKMQLAYPHKKVAHIPNGVDVEKFSKESNSNFRKEFSIPQNRKLILCVSRIDPQKNQVALLHLLQNLISKGENVHLALVGFITNNDYFNQIKSLAEEMKLIEHLTLCGGLSPDCDLLLSAYKSANVFALPSIHEPFGIVVLEAWASGLPVIASNIGGLGHLVDDAKSGFLFEPNNISQMTDAYFDSQKNRNEISKNAFSICAEKYSWESVAKQTLAFYKEVSK